MIPVTTVCNVYDDPAILLRVDPSALLMGVKVKGVESGRILELGGLLRPGIIDGKPYLGLPGFKIGELVACRIDAVDADDLDRWFADDHEVGLRDFMQDKVACLTTPEDLQEPPREAPSSHEDTEEASEDVHDEEEPQEDGEDMRCTRENILAVLNRNAGTPMSTADIATALGLGNIPSIRSRIGGKLRKLERGHYVRLVAEQSRTDITGGKPTLLWEAVE